MLVQFTLVPLGTTSDSLSAVLAKALKPITQSNLPYKAGPMSTTIEGEWDEIMNLINACRKILLQDFPRVSIQISVDDRKNATDRLHGKIKSLEEKMGIKLAK